MKTITFDRWEQGIDLRKGPSVQDANRLQEMDNCHVSTGWGIVGRPGFNLVTTLTPGSKGLFGFSGKLHTYSNNLMFQNNPLIVTNQVPLSTNRMLGVKQIHFNDVFNNAIYAAIEYDNGIVRHNYISGGSSEITDANCPHSKEVVKIQSKMWASDGDVVRFSATNAPTDWTASSDAGFLPTGLQAEGENMVSALGEYDGRLAVFHPDSTQIWLVDPDPQLHVLDSNIQNIGTRHSNSVRAVNGNLYFLTDVGFRSVSQQNINENYLDLDIGTQIDEIVRPLIGSGNVLSIYYAGGGQYWCSIGGNVFVFTISRTSKINAWSRYYFPFVVDNFTKLGEDIYIRSGEDVYIADPDSALDGTTPIDVNILTGYLPFKRPGRLKHIVGADVVCEGECEFSVLWDARDTSLETSPVTVSGDSRPGPLIPVEVMTTEAAFRFRSRNGKKFRLDSFSIYYHDLDSQ